MKLTWKPNLSTSALHAARAMAMSLPIVDNRLDASYRELSVELHEFALRLPVLARKNFWGELLSWSAELDSNRELAERVLVRLLGAQNIKATQLNFLASKITDIEAAFGVIYPKLLEQLELRSRPLKEFWEGYGSGLLAHVGRLTDKSLLVPQAEVILLQPVLGGYGSAHLGPNRVCVEAILTNVIPELPEVVRLAWLLVQLQLDTPIYSEGVHGGRLPEVAALAMLPPILAAGQIVELTKIDEPTLSLAIEQWQVPVLREDQDIVSKLLSWWETYLQTKPQWSVAFMALDRILQSA